MQKLLSILASEDYPGERFIGNNNWTTTILSHHNSITTNYAKQYTLYVCVKLFLKKAFEKGQISPFEMALIEEWYVMTKNDYGKTMYGILEYPQDDDIDTINLRRQAFGLRSLTTRNKLIKLQDKLKIKFYLDGDPWY